MSTRRDLRRAREALRRVVSGNRDVLESEVRLLGRLLGPEPHLRSFLYDRKSGSGTGFGLAIAYGIVTRHGGMILVESDPPTGTSFRVRLPVPAVATSE